MALTTTNNTITTTEYQVRYTTTAAHFPDLMPRDQWVSEGIMLFAVLGAIQWRVGDWLLYGEDNFDTYTQALHTLGLNDAQIKTFQNYVFVAKAIPPHRRREELSFGHHDAVAGCDPIVADGLLRDAIKGNWTVSAIRAERRKSTGEAIPAATTLTLTGDRDLLYTRLQAGKQYHIVATEIKKGIS